MKRASKDLPPAKKFKLEDKKGPEPEIYADPTYDVTFKMLFAEESNKDMLISLLNSLLGFRGAKEIIDVEINPRELLGDTYSAIKSERSITGSVDVLCTNKGKEKIAIEVQRQKTKYFLAREQYYMAKLISGQVKEKEGKLYNDKVLETHIIVITKKNVFVGNTALKDQGMYEIDVVPMIEQTKEVYPGNKMYWKFYELEKFVQNKAYRDINKSSPIKEQWLEFLVNCVNQREIPERAAIIKRGYEIMKIATWKADMQTLYWKQKAAEADLLLTIKEEKEEEYNKGKAEGEAKGLAKGLVKGKVEGEISKIKSLLEYEIEPEKIFAKMEYLKGESKEEGLNNIQYIKEHMADSDGDILAALWHVHDDRSEAEVVSAGEVLEAETGELG